MTAPGPAATLHALARHYRLAAAAPEPSPHDAQLLALAEHVEGVARRERTIGAHQTAEDTAELLAVAAAAGVKP